MNLGNRPPRILVVGAYDIDNFGDLLFLPITERYLIGASVVPSAPFAWDMSSIWNRRIGRYTPLLETETFDAIWTTGGEIGGSTIEHAFEMSAPAEVYQDFERSSPDERKELLTPFTGRRALASTYIPSPYAYDQNRGAITVINSAGISYMLEDQSMRDERVALLRGTTLVSVRDEGSCALLNDLGIDHRFVPDAVHALSRIWPTRETGMSDVAILQINARTLSWLGAATIAEGLASSRMLRGLRIRILPAGTFRGADSSEQNEDLVAHVRQADPNADIGIIKNRHPFELVACIRGARLVIGTSLHVRIVASAYNVPRLSLFDIETKVTNYARAWDPDLPYDVSLDALDDEIGNAISIADMVEVRKRSSRVSQLAHDNLQYLASRVRHMIATQTPDDVRQRAAARLALHAGVSGLRSSGLHP